MNLKRLAKLDRELAALRRAPHGRRPGEFERIARKLGRRKVNRGDEPNFGSPVVPNLGHPISIPHHQTLKTGTALNIITALENDCDLWRQHLDQQSDRAISDESDGDEEDDFDNE
jgi:hypothetical protein